MKEEIKTDNAPKAEAILSQGLRVGDVIYVSGQIHNTPAGQMVEGGVEEKLAQIISNIQAILESADATLDDIVKVVIYVTDMAQMPAVNQLYPSYFTKPLPVREAICVKELPLGATIEVSVIAHLNQAES